jgi:hypothetical protein
VIYPPYEIIDEPPRKTPAPAPEEKAADDTKVTAPVPFAAREAGFGTLQKLSRYAKTRSLLVARQTPREPPAIQLVESAA